MLCACNLTCDFPALGGAAGARIYECLQRAHAEQRAWRLSHTRHHSRVANASRSPPGARTGPETCLCFSVCSAALVRVALYVLQVWC